MEYGEDRGPPSSGKALRARHRHMSNRTYALITVYHFRAPLSAPAPLDYTTRPIKALQVLMTRLVQIMDKTMQHGLNGQNWTRALSARSIRARVVVQILRICARFCGIATAILHDVPIWVTVLDVLAFALLATTRPLGPGTCRTRLPCACPEGHILQMLLQGTISCNF